jgi:uncharacterized protein YdbL (DUF1318 family)
MKKNVFPILIGLILLSGAIANAIAFAGSEDIKKRMLDRLPTIVSLKQQGIVGENNKGFLEFVGDIKTGKETVEAENADRRTVYEAIAKQQASTVELVGTRRAIQIAETAQSGEWIQDSGGKWHQK